MLLLPSRQPGSPREGYTVQMHDRNDEEGIGSDLINDTIGKSVGRAAAGSP
jgi:hypothetical protein